MVNIIELLKFELMGKGLKQSAVRTGYTRYKYFFEDTDTLVTVKVFYDADEAAAIAEYLFETMYYSELLVIGEHFKSAHVSATICQY